MRVDRYKNHDIELVIDKLKVQAKDEERLKKSVQQALSQGDGLMLVLDADDETVRYYSKRLMVPRDGGWPIANRRHTISRSTPRKELVPSAKGWAWSM